MSGAQPPRGQGPGAPDTGAAPAGGPLPSPREVALAKLARARAALRGLREREEIEWQRGYIKALEEMLEVEGLSWRRSRRVATSISVEIARLSAAEWSDGTIAELSAGGCRLTTALAALTGGELLELSFRLPGLATPITLRASVLRSAALGERSAVALVFTDPAVAVAEALAAFLTRP